MTATNLLQLEAFLLTFFKLAFRTGELWRVDTGFGTLRYGLPDFDRCPIQFVAHCRFGPGIGYRTWKEAAQLLNLNYHVRNLIADAADGAGSTIDTEPELHARVRRQLLAATYQKEAA